MRKIIILQGLPASGKTTWAKKKCADSGNNYKRVNKDDLRDMFDDGKWSRTNEKFILKMRDWMISEILFNGYDVIVDDTNLAKKHIDQIKILAGLLANRIGTKTTVVVNRDFLKVTPEECIKRDLNRDRSVGADVIIKMYNTYIRPRPEKYQPDEGLPKALLVDVDGTLAKMVDRSPFDWDRVDEDNPNAPVINLVKKYKKDGYAIIILTGRDGSALGKTNSWLTKNSIPFDRVYIRPEGNNEKDAIIKKRIFDNHIKNKYNVEFVLDDRDQVVEMWRELGLTCLQVDFGDF